MTSSRQIEANRRNAQSSTGPETVLGKRRSRGNAIRHGLTAETVIGELEDAEDYAAFEAAILIDFEATSVVERELVLRLASLLWRLRRITAIESGLFKIQAERLEQFGRTRRTQREPEITDGRARTIPNVDVAEVQATTEETCSEGSSEFDALTRSYIQLCDLPTCPLDRLSRYEGTLWRQAGQILFTLQFINRRKPWTRMRPR